MAKVKLASYLTEISGRLGNIVLYNSYDKEYARIYVKPENPNSDKQKAVRKTFGDAVRSWQSLHSEEQQKYNKKARRLSLSGYNLYISLYMKDNLSWEDIKRDNRNLFTASKKHSDSIQRADLSVASTFQVLHSSYSESIQAVQRSAMR